VRTIDLHAPAAHVGVTDREKVGRIVGWIDRLQAVPRGRYACPAMVADPKTITLDFRDSANLLPVRHAYVRRGRMQVDRPHARRNPGGGMADQHERGRE
jgi:hypothetical protein